MVLLWGRPNDMLMVSHILFADDTLIFCGKDPTQLCYLKCILLFFEAISGLKINLGKSSWKNWP